MKWNPSFCNDYYLTIYHCKNFLYLNTEFEAYNFGVPVYKGVIPPYTLYKNCKNIDNNRSFEGIKFNMNFVEKRQKKLSETHLPLPLLSTKTTKT